MLEQPHFKHKEGNSTYIKKEDWPEVDATINWLIEKNRSGYKMVNSVRRLEEMKALMRGKLQQWDCRAGQNSLIIRTDGTLAFCFPMYSATHDWFSTLNHNLAYCYHATRAIRSVRKQAAHGFRGTTGSFED